MSSNDSYKISKTTRLVNLILYLEDKEYGATSKDIRSNVEGYNQEGRASESGKPGSKSSDAFERQFRRDRKDLEALGFPIEKLGASGDTAPRYKLLVDEARQEDPNLDYADIQLLILCARNALDDPRFFMRKELLQAMSKLESITKDSNLQDAVDGNVQTSPQDSISNDDSSRQDASSRRNIGKSAQPYGQDAAKSIFESVETAKSRRMKLEFEYQNATGSKELRHVLPISIYSYLGDLYIYAYDEARDDTRRFKFDRILGAPTLAKASKSLLEKASEHSNDDIALLPFQIGDSRSTAKLFISDGLEYKVHSLTMSKGSLEHTDGGYLWTIDSANNFGLAQWSIENGPGILILEPESAADLVDKGLQSILSGEPAININMDPSEDPNRDAATFGAGGDENDG